MAAHPDDLPARFGALSLEAAAAMLAEQRLPPVDRWDPPHCGDSHMEIRSDGSWWHRGGEIRRPALVRLFASILRREADGSYALVTPHEKQAIDVVDLPFRAVELLAQGEGEGRQLIFRLDDGTLVRAGPEHPLRFDGSVDDPRPQLHVRGPLGCGLAARLVRSVYYELVELALTDGMDPPAIWSGGQRFGLTP